MSKESKALVYSDAVWEPHVRSLLAILYDDAFVVASGGKKEAKEKLKEIGLLSSKSTLKSTDFRAWLEEWKSAGSEKWADVDSGLSAFFVDSLHDYLTSFVEDGYINLMEDDLFRWAFHDVPLRNYYLGVGSIALRLQNITVNGLDDLGYCIACIHPRDECLCEEGQDAAVHRAAAFSAFDPLPPIVLFSPSWRT